MHSHNTIHDCRVAEVVIEHLALDEADLRARVLEVEHDLTISRRMLSEALYVAHELTLVRDGYEAKYHGALNEGRRLREQIKSLRAENTELRESLSRCQRGRAA